MYKQKRKDKNMTVYDVEAVLQEQGYDSDGLLDELVYQVKWILKMISLVIWNGCLFLQSFCKGRN